MSKKTVLITINHPPFSGNFCTEGLRTVVGTHLSIEGHAVKTAFLGDGVYFCLKNCDKKDFVKYLKTLKAMGMELFVEKESLENRKLTGEMLEPEFSVTSREELLPHLKKADHVLAY